MPAPLTSAPKIRAPLSFYFPRWGQLCLGCFLGMFFGGAGVSCYGTSRHRRGPHPAPVPAVGTGVPGGLQPRSRKGFGLAQGGR